MYVKIHVCNIFVVLNAIVYQYNLSTYRKRFFFYLDEYELVLE